MWWLKRGIISMSMLGWEEGWKNTMDLAICTCENGSKAWTEWGLTWHFYRSMMPCPCVATQQSLKTQWRSYICCSTVWGNDLREWCNGGIHLVFTFGVTKWYSMFAKGGFCLPVIFYCLVILHLFKQNADSETWKRVRTTCCCGLEVEPQFEYLNENQCNLVKLIQLFNCSL